MLKKRKNYSLGFPLIFIFANNKYEIARIGFRVN